MYVHEHLLHVHVAGTSPVSAHVVTLSTPMWLALFPGYSPSFIAQLKKNSGYNAI